MSRRFGNLLRRYREDNDLTGTQLVLDLQDKLLTKKYSKADVSKWENGSTKPPIDVIRALEDILEVPDSQLVEAAGAQWSTHSTNAGWNTEGLYNEVVRLAKELEVFIRLEPPHAIIVPEPIRRMMFPKGEIPRSEAFTADRFEKWLRSHPDISALYDRFVSLQTSRGFRNALAQWKRNIRAYAESVEYSESPELVEQAYHRAKECAHKATEELWRAVQACRWGDS